MQSHKIENKVKFSMPSFLIEGAVTDEPDKLLSEQKYDEAFECLTKEETRTEIVDDPLNYVYSTHNQVAVTFKELVHASPKHYFQLGCLYLYGLGCDIDYNAAYKKFDIAISYGNKEVLQALLNHLNHSVMIFDNRFLALVGFANIKLGDLARAKEILSNIYNKIEEKEIHEEVKKHYLSLLKELNDIDELKAMASKGDNEALLTLIDMAQSKNDPELKLIVASVVRNFNHKTYERQGVQFLIDAIQADYQSAIEYASRDALYGSDPRVQVQLSMYHAKQENFVSATYYASLSARQGNKKAIEILKLWALEHDEPKMELAALYLTRNNVDAAVDYAFNQFDDHHQIYEDNEVNRKRLTLFKDIEVRQLLQSEVYEGFAKTHFIPAMQNDIELVELLPILIVEQTIFGNESFKKELEAHLHNTILNCCRHLTQQSQDMLLALAKTNKEAKFFAAYAICQSDENIETAKQLLQEAVSHPNPYYPAGMLVQNDFSQSEREKFNHNWEESKRALLPARQLLQFIDKCQGSFAKFKLTHFQKGDILAKVKDFLEKNPSTTLLDLMVKLEDFSSQSDSKLSKKIVGFMLHQLFNGNLLENELTIENSATFSKSSRYS